MSESERKKECRRALYNLFMELLEESSKTILFEQRKRNIESMVKIYTTLFLKEENEPKCRYTHMGLDGVIKNWVGYGDGWEKEEKK